MRKTLANTSLSPASAHCLVEIGTYDVHHVDDLRARLMLKASEFELVLEELRLHGYVTAPSPTDNGDTVFLTPAGEVTLDAMNAYAMERVGGALEATPHTAADDIVRAIKLYADALSSSRRQPTLTSAPEAPPVQVLPGYRPGILGATLSMHLDYYSKSVGFGRAFETGLAADFGDLINRLHNPVNQLWAAVRTAPDGRERILGTIMIDGESLGQQGAAQLRGFIVDKSLRGLGVGRKMLAHAMSFVDEQGFHQVKLVTAAVSTAAHYLYEDAGFVLSLDGEREAWGQKVRVLEYVWRRPASPAPQPDSLS